MISQEEFDNRCIKLWKMVYLTYGMNFPSTWNDTLEQIWMELYDIYAPDDKDIVFNPTYLGIDSAINLDWATRGRYFDSPLTFTQKFIDEVVNVT